MVVTVNEQNEVQAFKLPAGAGPLFPAIKNDERARIKETAVDAEALLPDGPYDLWCDDDDARRVTVGPEARQDPLLEVVLPDRCEIGALSGALLGPGVLPELWSNGQVTISALREYFAGGRTVRVSREGYEETQVIPECSEQAVHEAVRGAVEQGAVWLTNGPASVWKEQIPYGVLDDDAVLHPRPDPIAAQELAADALPGAWREGRTNGVALARALSQSRRRTLPRGIVREGIKAGVGSRWLEVADGSVAVHCRYDEAGQLRLKRPETIVDPTLPPAPSVTGVLLEVGDGVASVLDADGQAHQARTARPVNGGPSAPGECTPAGSQARRTTRPSTRPARRSSRAACAAASGRSSIGNSGTAPERPRASNSDISAGLPTYDPRMVICFSGSNGNASCRAPPNSPTTMSVPPGARAPKARAAERSDPTKSIAAGTPPRVLRLICFTASAAAASNVPAAPRLPATSNRPGSTSAQSTCASTTDGANPSAAIPTPPRPTISRSPPATPAADALCRAP